MSDWIIRDLDSGTQLPFSTDQQLWNTLSSCDWNKLYVVKFPWTEPMHLACYQVPLSLGINCLDQSRNGYHATPQHYTRIEQ